MNKEIVEKAFTECFNDLPEDILDRRKFTERWYKEKEKGGNRAGIESEIAYAYSEALRNAIEYTKAAMIKLLDSDAFKRELFKDMMEQAKKEQQRTQRNPFEV